MGDEGDWKSHYHPFAVAVTTISVFHIKGLLNVISRHFGVAFNIPRHNVGIYASKLISYRFFLGLVGSALELILHKIFKAISKLAFESDAGDIASKIKTQGAAIKTAITPIGQQIAPAAGNAEAIKKNAGDIAGNIVVQPGIQGVITDKAKYLAPNDKGDIDKAKGAVADILKNIISGEAGDLAEKVAGISSSGDADQVAQQIVDYLGTTKNSDIKGQIRDKMAGEMADMIRRGISISTLVWMGICKVVFLRKLYSSRNLAYDAYVILNAEGLSWGVVQMTLFPLTPMHSAVTTMSIDVSTMTIFFFQLALDAFLFHRPLYMIKIEMWIIVFWNLVAIPIWLCSIYKALPDPSGFGAECQGGSNDSGYLALWSPFWMFPFISFIKDFLFPGVMPFALLTPDQAHLTNIVFPPVYNLGSLLVICLDGWGGTWNLLGTCARFKYWNLEYHYFWGLYIPQVLNYACIFMAIHGDGELNKLVLGNRPLVLFMDLVMMLCYSIMESLSYVGVANFTYSSANKGGTKAYLETHNLLAEVYRFSFSKASVGYNTLRNRYGLGMNVVHPHRLRPPGAWYWVRESCRISYLDTKNDLRMNIGEYI